MEHKDQHEQAHDKVETSIGSMLFSILLVALAMGFVFGFKYYLSGRTYHGPKITGYLDEESAEEGSADEIVMDVDHSFHNEYVMVQDLRDKELWASPKPVKKEDKAGKPDKKAIQVKEGDILKVKERGTFEGERYYLLDNGLYLADTRAIIP
ncbi:MAG: hypothetical protein IJ137_06570 [Eubacterium sp.]|nr:hypothetical protein [Eubacterium sp.]